ncbi:MAG TPA: hypothetical protein VG604_01970 [Candidatus Saccharimonadales bacterium]|nr:hypothetical protein [Candidatus Saccharimonadales bacterium]
MKNKRFLFAAAALMLSLLLPDIANAAALKQASLEIDRLAASAAPASLFVTVKFNTTAGVSKVALCFATGFTVNGSATPAVSTANRPNTPATTALPTSGSFTATMVTGSSTDCPSGAGGIVVGNVGSVNATTLYGFYVTAPGITNPSSANQYNNYVSSVDGSDVPIDTTSTPTYITTSTGDQVTVTASVAPTFNFSLSSTTDQTTSPADPNTPQDTAGVNMQVGTNSPLGYTAYVKSGQGYLSSPETSTHITTGTFDGTADTITTPTSILYGFIPSTGAPASQATGALTYDGEYSDGAGSYITSSTAAGAFNGTNFASFVSRAGYTSGDNITLKERIAVDSSIGYANDYTDTLTIVAAGNY